MPNNLSIWLSVANIKWIIGLFSVHLPYCQITLEKEVGMPIWLVYSANNAYIASTFINGYFFSEPMKISYPGEIYLEGYGNSSWVIQRGA